MKNLLGVILVFIVLTIAMTYPLVFKINTHIPGFFSSDEFYGSVWNSWRIKYSITHHISLSHTSLIAYPFGIDLYKPWVFSYLWIAIFHFLSFLSTPALTYNIIVLVNLFLSGIFTYLLIFYITRNKLGAIMGGAAFAFCPYQFARAWQHLGLTQNEWIPLALFAAILFKNYMSKKYAILFIISLTLPFYLDPTITFFVFTSIAVFLIYVMFYNWKIKLSDKKLLRENLVYFKKVFLVGMVTFAIFIPQILPIIQNRTKISDSSKASAFNVYHRPFQDLFTQSAKPLSYLLPAIYHPVFGKFTEQFIGSPLYGVSYTEHTLYLGWAPLILSFIVYKNWRKRRKNYKSQIPSFQIEDFYIGFFVLLAIAAWLCSQPPYFTFPYFKIYMPSFFMYKIFPMGRAYCRFGIVVMLAVSVLAGFGLKFILERFKSNKTKVIFASLACGLVLFEFLNFPPFKVIDLTKYPKVYDWLKQQKGDFAIAEYPLDTASPNEYYKFCQTIHEKKIINGTMPGTYANKVAKTMWELSEPRTAGILSWMKLKYVLVHLGSYEKDNNVEIATELQKIKTRKIEGLKFIRSFENVDVYEITARPKEPII